MWFDFRARRRRCPPNYADKTLIGLKVLSNGQAQPTLLPTHVAWREVSTCLNRGGPRV